MQTSTYSPDLDMRLDHIGFLVADIEREMATFNVLFPGTVWSPLVVDPLQDVAARFGRTPQALVYELVEPTSQNSPVAHSLKARKNLLNHVCYRCVNLASKALELRANGFFPVTEAKPGKAFGNEPIQFFFHTNGLLIELVQGTAGPFDARSK
jgi:Glyoxalase/Bleomycin resistance protein/Dioxygenase superfamily